MERLKAYAHARLSKLLVRRFVAVVRTYDVGYGEVQTAGLAILWGAWVASPFWDALAHMHAHRLLPYITQGCEWIWGSAALTIGILHFAGMYFDTPDLEFLTRRIVDIRWWRKTFTMCSFLLWTFITLAYAQVEWRSAVWWLYAMFALSSIRSYMQIAQAGMGNGKRHAEGDNHGDGDASKRRGGGQDRRLDQHPQRQAS